ncbi:hypothetical protein RB443 [Rhodopirellula baltica SH 1]|uniref:Uncharacterized protein n=2 Tax=Rhodopirellula baltica TaxID=265606 RepID=Q7UYQ9_RHOBA|nr:hypothetical protein RB443 [Rhodopirellula baltica SH 1]
MRQMQKTKFASLLRAIEKGDEPVSSLDADEEENKSRPLLSAIELENGLRPHPSTATRWCLEPNRHGNVLKSWLIGGRRMTSIAAVKEYNAANNQQSMASDSTAAASSIANSKTHSKAMQDLESEGL